MAGGQAGSAWGARFGAFRVGGRKAVCCWAAQERDVTLYIGMAWTMLGHAQDTPPLLLTLAGPAQHPLKDSAGPGKCRWEACIRPTWRNLSHTGARHGQKCPTSGVHPKPSSPLCFATPACYHFTLFRYSYTTCSLVFTTVTARHHHQPPLPGPPLLRTVDLELLPPSVYRQIVHQGRQCSCL